MINAILIEDERPAMEALEKLLNDASVDIVVKTRLGSVKESIAYLEEGHDADLIFSDVQLADGLAFAIFKKAKIRIPVIFITAYDKFMMMAFENNGIDYLLKPVEKKDLEKALSKFNKLQEHFSKTITNSHLENLEKFISEHKKTRLLVKKGQENIALLMEDVAFIYIQDKTVCVMDRFSNKFISDNTLAELEQKLDSVNFFRANRQSLVNIKYIKSFKPFERVKLQIEMTIPGTDQPIIVSQETASDFKRWIREA